MAAEQSATPPQRLFALDAFRGLVIVLMFLVNVAGRDPHLGAWFLEWFPHKGWNGGRMGNGVADYVFPWFLFIVGVAVPFSMASGRGGPLSASRRIRAALRRGVVIYLLGTLLWCATIALKPEFASGTSEGALPKWHGPIDWRVILHWDILPLIGLAYVLAVCAWHVPVWARWAAVAAVLTAKFIMLTMIALPGGDGAVVWEAGRSVDHWVKGELGWFGVLLTQGLPAAATAVLGVQAGEWLRRGEPSVGQRAAGLIAAGVLSGGASYLLHRYAGMPYSKDFFTSSYVLVSAGTGAAVLGVMLMVIDARKWTTLEWLRVFGMNAIAVYLAAELLWKLVLTRWQVAMPAADDAYAQPGAWRSSASIFGWARHWLDHPLGPTAGGVAIVVLYVGAYWLLCRWLHARRWYVKV